VWKCTICILCISLSIYIDICECVFHSQAKPKSGFCLRALDFCKRTDMETAREHIEAIRKKMFSIEGEENPLTEDLHQAVKNLSAELYAKDVHFLMELIQVPSQLILSSSICLCVCVFVCILICYGFLMMLL
jgi:hypothetical protein